MDGREEGGERTRTRAACSIQIETEGKIGRERKRTHLLKQQQLPSKRTTTTKAKHGQKGKSKHLVVVFISVIEKERLETKDELKN